MESRNIHGVQGAEYFGKRPQANLTCHPSYPSRSGKYGLWPPVIFVENDSKNPVSIRLCESEFSDTCSSEEYVKCYHIIAPQSTGVLHTPEHLQFFIFICAP